METTIIGHISCSFGVRDIVFCIRIPALIKCYVQILMRTVLICGQTYNPTQSNIKALDKDANTHNKRPVLLGDPPTKRHKQQNQQTIPHQTRRPGLLGERPTNTATYTYNKTNWLSHRNTNTANNTNHPFPHKRVPLMSIKFTKPPTTTPQSHSKNYKRQRPHNPPKNTI